MTGMCRSVLSFYTLLIITAAQEALDFGIVDAILEKSPKSHTAEP